MDVQAMQCKLYNFGDSSHKLNALVFALETGVAQYKDELENSH